MITQIMKRLVFFTLLIFAGIHMQGQVRYGVKGGMNVSKFDKFTSNIPEIPDEFQNVELSNLYTVHAGGFAEIQIDGFFSVQPELLFSVKGTHCRLSYAYVLIIPPNTGGYVVCRYIEEITYTSCYIELPIYLKAGFEAGQGKIIVGMGPYFAYGIAGKLKAELHEKELSTFRTIGVVEKNVFTSDKLKVKVNNFFFPESELKIEKDQLKRFDAGFGGFVGYELNRGFLVTAGFQKGLYNIDDFEDDRDKLRNNTFILSIGYKF